MENKNLKIDFIKFRKDEIEFAIQKAKHEEEKKEIKEEKKKITINKKRIFLQFYMNIFYYISYYKSFSRCIFYRKNWIIWMQKSFY